MKMLCIRGRVHPYHTGLLSGQVYEVSAVPPCPSCGQAEGVHAEGVVFHRQIPLRCAKCKRGRQVFKSVPWGKRRFVPFDPSKLGVTMTEVKKLYAPGVNKPVKEKA